MAPMYLDQKPSFDGPPPDYEAEIAPSSSANSPEHSPQLACLSINIFDRIRFIGFSELDVAAIHDVVRANWSKGVDCVQSCGGAREIKIKGLPWHPNINGNDEARKLLLAVVAQLYERRWMTYTSLRFTLRSALDKGSLFFRKATSQESPSKDFICISFDHLSKLKIVGDVPAKLSGAIVQSLGSQISKQEVSPDRLKVNLVGNAWLAANEESVCTQFLILKVLEILESYGYKPYMTLETQNGHSGHEMESLICGKLRVSP